MKKIISIAFAAVFASTTAVSAQEFSLGADIVSRYVWRGMDQASGASFQPSLGFSWGDFSIGAWGSTSIANLEAKEVDLSIGYSHGGFSATFTDYFWAGESASYGYYNDDHYFELALGYSFEKVPLSISWATMLFGGETAELNADGDRMFSTYINLGYEFELAGVSFAPAIGINPWESQFSDEFDIMDITLTASKELKITESFTLPIFSQLIISPACDKTYLVFGLSL